MISFGIETDEEDEHKKWNNREDEGDEEHFEDEGNVENSHIRLEELDDEVEEAEEDWRARAKIVSTKMKKNFKS